MHSYSALSGGVALAMIMVPVIARTAEESLRLVPNTMREAALAFGITRWRAVIGVIIPGAMTGIITGMMLGVARIAGETAPLLFTALGSQFGVQGLLKPIGALPLQIYLMPCRLINQNNNKPGRGLSLVIWSSASVSWCVGLVTGKECKPFGVNIWKKK